ncbi:FecR family protein [Galbibacter mesophilus]|uniref:FecR family protein n=1 Tax=Galbibacter mesophilus TaxID=379069 RepID=UPI00191EF829|nr:FecR family protein [Galbibacter mesophilus]MCM5663174.1 FecR domain-containing protein [Galbibacter mesophilus]
MRTISETRIIVKSLHTDLSEEERVILNAWLSKSSDNQFLYQRLLQMKKRGVAIPDLEEIDSEEVWEKLLTKKKNHQKYTLRRKQSLLAYAAVFIGVLFLGGTLVFQNFGKEQNVISNQDTITLELDNGEVRTIVSGQSQAVKDKSGKVIGLQQGQSITYKNVEEPKKLLYNTLRVPYGKRFDVKLSDGTVVHLNAGSSLKYPVQFLKGKNRQVFLTGEAFFDVTTNKESPFIVTSKSMDVQVLGTKFNVNAYDELTSIQTVLVEGSVKLTSKDASSGEGALLTPGHKASWNTETHEVGIDKVDTSIYTSWIDGKLVFKQMKFKHIMLQLKRHFDVEIESNYEHLNNQVFTASFDEESLEAILSSFALETPFAFERNNNKIIINNP